MVGAGVETWGRGGRGGELEGEGELGTEVTNCLPINITTPPIPRKGRLGDEWMSAALVFF